MLRRTVRPEFLNRIDEIIMFHALTAEHVREILKLQIALINDLLQPKGLILDVTEQAYDYLQNRV